MVKKSKNKAKAVDNTIALNKKARHDFAIEQTFEAGLALEGWEVKSLRSGRAQLVDSYVVVKRGEVWLLGAHIPPLLSASTHVDPDPARTRKLLLHREEINKMLGWVERKGYTLVPLKLYWKNNRAKIEVGLAKGKKIHEKRDTIKERDWARQKDRIFKQNDRN